MTEPPSRLLRILVPVLLLVAAVGVGWAVLRNSSQPVRPPTGTPATHPASPPAPTPAAPSGPQSVQPPSQPQPAAPAVPLPEGFLAGLSARALSAEDAAKPLEPLGRLDDPAVPLRLEFSPYGAGLRSITLSRYYTSIARAPESHVVVQHERRREFQLQTEQRERRFEVAAPLGAARVMINEFGVPLFGILNAPGRDAEDVPIWRQVAPGSFEAVVVNEAGREIVRITRTFELPPGTHSIHVRQRMENLTDQPLTLRLYQYGPVDFDYERLAYSGDRRRVPFGYLARPSMDPTRQLVLADAYELLMRATVLTAREPTVWPRKTGVEAGHELVWFGMANRYFAAALFPLIDPAVPAPPLPGPDKVFRSVEQIYAVALEGRGVPAPEATMALQFCTPAYALAPGASASADFGAYAGPLSRDLIEADPVTGSLGLSGLAVYNLGGACSFCTFAWLANLLLGLLHTLHHYLLHDWALSIILLVVIVRTILHPVTKWSQIRITRFGKQMQELAPKQKKLQEKYKDDPKKLREETARLWREGGVSPAGMLGCVPAVLQTPIWIALYATLFFDFDLRHQAAFFGLFQSLSGGAWWFLGDLSSPDHFIGFGSRVQVPLLSSLVGPIDGLNVLPIILGFVFFIQQKYLTPPSTAQLTPEQEQTQRITKIMMVVMFPLFMYNAPSGLALYFLTNSTLGILEGKYIRSHIDKYDLGKAKGPQDARPGGPKKPAGFIARLQAALEERQRQLSRHRQGQPKRRG